MDVSGPPLLIGFDILQTTEERPPERLHYVGVSFGLTAGLLKFWSRSSFDPVYLRLTQNDLTGEHTCIMLRALECSDLEEGPSEGWLQAYTEGRIHFLKASALPILNACSHHTPTWTNVLLVL